MESTGKYSTSRQAVAKHLRLLHLPNERELDLRRKQIGARKAFQHLLDSGVLQDYEVFSFLWEAKQLGSAPATLEKLLQVAEHFQPDLIFWQHISEFDVTSAFLKRLKAISSKPKLVYHEADPYGRFIKRMNRPLRTILPEADLVFLVGMGQFAELARKYGAKNVLYAPHNFETVRFGQPWQPTLEREHDVVMIANFGGTRIPGRYFPGAKTRLKLARALCRRFGQRFALYGNGWKRLACARGSLPFFDQEKAIRSAWVSINWDHFDTVPYYFSNRLPISLAAGVPHITCYHPGYEYLFKECEGLYAVHSVEEAVDTANYLVGLPPEELIYLGEQGRRFVFEHLEATVVYTEILETCTRHLFQAAHVHDDVYGNGIG